MQQPAPPAGRDRSCRARSAAVVVERVDLVRLAGKARTTGSTFAGADDAIFVDVVAVVKDKIEALGGELPIRREVAVFIALAPDNAKRSCATGAHGWQRPDAAHRAALTADGEVIEIVASRLGPPTSTCTAWPSSGWAMAVPCCATWRMRSSVATAQATSTAFRGMPPPRSNGRGAIFVQSTKPSGAGSPEATPSAKGEAAKTGLAQTPP